MIKKLILCLLLSIGVLSGCVSQKTVDTDKDFLFAHNPDIAFVRSIVKVDVSQLNPTTRPDGYLGGYASGIVLRNTDKYTYILTAKHVVAKADKYSFITIYMSENQFLAPKYSGAAKIYYQSDRMDFCILRTDRIKDVVPIEIYKGMYPAIVSPIYIAGHANGRPLAITKGTIVAYYPEDFVNWIARLRFNGFIEPGDSGGAILTLDGKLIGLITGKFAATDGSSIVAWEINAEILEKVKFE